MIFAKILANHKICFKSLFDEINNFNAVNENLINSNAVEYHDISSVNSLINATKILQQYLFMIYFNSISLQKISTNYENIFVI